MNTELARGPVRMGLVAVLLVALAAALATLLWTGPTLRAQEAPAATYTNPVSRGAVEGFPDPTIIKARDGYWYAYSTYQRTPDSYLGIMRSKDLVEWEYVDSVFTSSTRPDWHSAQSSDPSFLWAPDIRYLNGKYYLYYSLAQPPIPDGYFTVGVATAPTPAGPWTDSGGPVIEQGACDTFTNIDPAQFTDRDGTKYLYWGSFRNLCVAELNGEGTRVVGPAKEIYKGPAEGPYVVRNGDFYYLFVSEATCCNGTLSGYTVKVGRSRSPMGPFVDREGIPMTASQTKGAFVLSANGNRWVGPGHHSQFTDLSGQDWFAYHGIDRTDGTGGPEVYGGRRREMLIDRLDWSGGWPTVRAGEWASEDAQPAPVSEWIAGDDFNGREEIGKAWRRKGQAQGGWRLESEQDAGGYAYQREATGKPSYLVSARKVPEDLRAEADLRMPARSRGAAGLVTAYQDEKNYVVAWLDARKDALVTDVRVNGRSEGTRQTSLPAGFRFDDWHNVAVEVRDGRALFEVTDARLGDPLAVQERTLPAKAVRSGSVGVASLRAETAADNVGGARLYEPARDVEEPATGTLDPLYGDEFDDGVNPGSEPGSPWTWVRAPEGEEAGGVFRWTADGNELFGRDNSASVLTRDAPEGEYTVETKLVFDAEVPFQQAGLIAYTGDDRYVKLVSNVTGAGPDYDGFHRQTEFGKEVPAGPDGFYGVMFVGPPADSLTAPLWLRLRHTLDPVNGEHEYRAFTSRDGETWTRGGVWALPSETSPKIGLISMNTAGATAEFDYVRTYRP